MAFTGKAQLPVLGVGLSFRPEIATALYDNVQHFDFMEIILDNAVAGMVDDRFWTSVASRLSTGGDIMR